MLFSLAYVSRARIPAHSVDLIDIARASMRNNRGLGLSGALYFDDQQFFQVLEGEPAAVRTMFARIGADARHTDIVLLREGPVAERRFENWSMKFIDGAWVADGYALFAYEALRAAPPTHLDLRMGALANMA